MNLLTSLILILFLFGTANAQSVTEDQEELFMMQHATGDFSVVPLTPPTAGCTVTVSGAFVGDGTDMVFGSPAVFDSDANSYTVTQSSLAGRQIAMIAVADNVAVSGGYGITVSPSAGDFGYYGLAVFKSFCGLANPSVDQTATAAEPGPQPSDATVATASSSQANETAIVALGLCNVGDSNLNISMPGYTEALINQDCSITQAGGVWWKNVTTQGVHSATASHDDITGSGVYDGWVIAIVTLKDAVAGGGAVARRRSVIVQ